MALTLNYNKIGVVLDALLIICFVAALVVFPPLFKGGESSGDDGLGNLDAIEEQLNLLVDSGRETIREISNIRGELEVVRGLSADIGSAIRFEYSTNLESGDIIIESGINHDESLLLIRELERRFAEREE